MIRDFLSLTGIIAGVIFAAIGGVLLLVSGWTILLAPFWMAGCIKATIWLIDRRMGS